MDTQWLRWVQRLQAIAQNGLAYSQDPFDRERFEQVRSVAADILAAASPLDPALIRDLLWGERGYATPKIDVRGAVFQGQRLLLVREASDGLWTLPGGWADVRESPTAAVGREIWEESGFTTTVTKLIALYDRQKHAHPPMFFHVYKAFFLCDLVGGSATLSHETSAVEFFGLADLPQLSTPRVTAQQIERCFAHYLNPALPTEFD
jgi:ADP-ribose pyrophosphatase YjhB (NUDIX family)